VPSLPKASVIIVNWNGLKLLPDCLSSLRAQTVKDFEIILVDNGSADGSAAYVKENYPSVRLLEAGENLGFAKGNNVGAKAAEGDVLVLLNNDTAVEPDWLEKLLAPLERDPSIGAAGSKLIYFDDKEEINSVGTFVSVLGFSGSVGDGMPRAAYAAEQEVFAACGGALAIRRKLYLEVGGLYEPFFMYEDDVDLGWKVWNAGLRVVLAPDSIVYHKYSRTQKPYKYYFMTRNKLWCAWKNARTRDLLFLMPASVAFSKALFLAFLCTLKFENAKQVARGLIDGLKSLPAREPARNSLASRHYLGVRDSLAAAFRKSGKHFS